MNATSYRFQVGPMANSSYREVASVPLFDGEECARLVATRSPAMWHSAQITKDGGYGSATDPAVRSAALQALTDGEEWAVRKLVRAISDINDTTFRFRLWGVPENDRPSVLRYRADEGGHFSPHIDAGPSMSTRKLTYVVQLSDPSAYTGGDLVVLDGSRHISKERGTLVVFPSGLNHVVSPVTEGERFVLVGWVHGPTLS